MQRAPPRPRPSSSPGIGSTVMPRFVVFFVGPDVALVANHHAGADGQHVVGVVPLFTFGLKRVAAGSDQAYLIDTQRFFDGVQQIGFLRTQPGRRVRQA